MAQPTTREHILAAARTLFNAQGFGNVTTAALAQAAGVAEGNLWYHFKNKRSLLEAISEAFVPRITARLAIRPRPGVSVMDEYVRFLRAFAAELNDFRFLYRDQADYGEHAPPVLLRLPDFYARTDEQLTAFFEAMIAAGDLEWPAERIPALVVNSMIVIRFGLEFLRESRGGREHGAAAVDETFLQHLTLFEHALRPEAAKRLRAGWAEGATVEAA